MLLSPGLSFALYTRLLGERSIDTAWMLGRLALLVSGLSMLLVGVSLGVDMLTTLLPVAPVLLVVQALVASFFDKKVVGVASYGFPEGTYRVRLIDEHRVAAFTLPVSGKLYASTQLVERLDPGEMTAVVAHEVGHRRALQPLPPALAMTLLVVAFAWALEASIIAAVEGRVLLGLLGIMATSSAWVFYSWVWEHLADIHSLRLTGHYAVSALQRITGALPEKPMWRNTLTALLNSIRPRLAAGLLVNPHPSPGLRLWLLLNLLGSVTSNRAPEQQRSQPLNMTVVPGLSQPYTRLQDGGNSGNIDDA